MKHKGAVMEYSRERFLDLMRAYEIYMEQCPYIRMSELYRTIVDMPASRFWVSDKRAAVVVSRMEKGSIRLDRMHRLRAEMYVEIYRRVCELRSNRPELSILEACAEVVEQPAPKFYLDPRTAKTLIWKGKKKWLEEKWRRLGLFR